MTALDTIPENKNFLSPLGFKFQVKKCPTVNFFVQTVNIPSIVLPDTYAPNPFVKIPYSGEHITYGDLTLTFKVDEDLVNYLEIHNWIKALGFPDKFDQYDVINRKPIMSGEGIRSDISLLVLSSSRNPTYDITFKDAFPVSLSGVEFDTRTQDVQYVTATTTFKYISYEINQI